LAAARRLGVAGLDDGLALARVAHGGEGRRRSLHRAERRGLLGADAGFAGAAAAPGTIRAGPRHLAQLGRVEGAALVLVVREVGLLEDVAEEAELVGAEEDVPDVAEEPRPVLRVPAQPP